MRVVAGRAAIAVAGQSGGGGLVRATAYKRRLWAAADGDVPASVLEEHWQ